MRYDKELYAPEERYAVEQVDPSRLREGQTATLDNMRQTDSGIVAAEGSKLVITLPSSAAPTKLYVTGGDVYAYGSGNHGIYGLTSGISSGGIQTEPVAVLSHFTDEGEEGIYSVEEGAVRYIRGSAVEHTDSIGGTCAAIHHGRLFTAKGYRLIFSAPHSPDGITETERDPDRAGHIDFDKERGEIVALISFRERLYLFFRRGIMKLSAEGESVDFEATSMPYAGGEIIAGSVTSCGDRICYLTDRGLWSFDGSKSTFLERQDDIDLLSPVNAFNYKGCYGAAVKRRATGQTVVYIFDPTAKTRRFLTADGLTAAAGEYYLAGNRVYRFTETESSSERGSLVLTLRASRPLAWVKILGYGEFEVRTNVKSGVFSAAAGQKVRIHAAKTSTETMLTVEAKDTAFRILAVDIGWRDSDAD